MDMYAQRYGGRRDLGLELNVQAPPAEGPMFPQLKLHVEGRSTSIRKVH